MITQAKVIKATVKVNNTKINIFRNLKKKNAIYNLKRRFTGPYQKSSIDAYKNKKNHKFVKCK